MLLIPENSILVTGRHQTLQDLQMRSVELGLLSSLIQSDLRNEEVYYRVDVYLHVWGMWLWGSLWERRDKACGMGGLETQVTGGCRVFNYNFDVVVA